MTDHAGENASMNQIEEAIAAHWGPEVPPFNQSK